MHLLKCNLALFTSQWALVLTQQLCYWPDGSGLRPGQGSWVNCDASEDSVCCLSEDVCLANGLCFGSTINMVYRGGCTIKDWSNTTACPNQWCNNVQKDTWSNVWRCPDLKNRAVQWWFGDETETKTCQAGIDAQFFVNYTTGHVLGFPPIASSSSATTKTSNDVVTTTFSAGPSSTATSVPESSSAKTSTDQPVPTQAQGNSINLPTDSPAPAQNQEHSASTPAAIGVAIGVPLGVAAIGFLGFLFWKEARRQRTVTDKSRIVSREPALGNVNQSAIVAIDGSWNELPDAPLPRELGGVSRTELSNI